MNIAINENQYNNNSILESIIDICSLKFFIYGLLVQFIPETQPRV